MDPAELVEITTDTIEDFRGNLTLKKGDLPFEIWDVFSLQAFQSLDNTQLVPVKRLTSRKNQLSDPRFVAGSKKDPRQTAFDFMSLAGQGHCPKRDPLTVKLAGEAFEITDGNATAQVLMLVGWNEAPVTIIRD